MELEFIKASAAQKDDLEAARSLIAQQQEEDRRRQALIEAENKKREAKNWLCSQADQLAQKKATHQLFVGSRMGGDRELFSDWATLETHENTSVLQASIRRWTPDESDATRTVSIQVRLKDIETGVTSGAESVLRFNIATQETYLRDNTTGREVEVAPESVEYAEVRALLLELETAEYEVTQEPLIGS